MSLMAGMILNFLTCTCILFMIANSMPPEDPIKCSSINTNCTISNAYDTFPDRSTCHVAEVFYPKSEADIISIIAKATKAKRKIKVATRYSHSIPKLICPDDHDGIVISTKNLSHVIEIDRSKISMTVESGVILRDLIEEAAKAGLALPYTPYYSGLTIGGLMSTGAHGSTLWGKGSAVHDYVVEMRIVSPGRAEEGYVVLRTLHEDGLGPEMDATRVSLGVLGVISQVTLRLQPMFKRSITFVKKGDFNLAEEAVEFGRKHEFADIVWFPSQKLAIYRFDDRVPSQVPGNGSLNHPKSLPTPSSTLIALRSTGGVHINKNMKKEEEEIKHDADGKCVQGNRMITQMVNDAFGLTNDGVNFIGYPVVGYQNHMQASGSCLDDTQIMDVCSWDPRIKGLFYFETTFSIEFAKVKYFIQDVKKLVDLDPKSLCGLDVYGGILMRYMTRSTAYLGEQEDAVDFDMVYYRSRDPKSPRMYEDVLEEIEQMGIFKYDGLPHWGKNRIVTFDGVIKKYKNVSEFLKVKNEFDPFGLFTNEWTDRVLGQKDGVSIAEEGCALEGLCVCSEDIHCAPEKGYFCRHGKVFEGARVCAFEPKDMWCF